MSAKPFHQKQLESRKFNRIHQGLESGSGPGGRHSELVMHSLVSLVSVLGGNLNQTGETVETIETVQIVEIASIHALFTHIPENTDG